MVFIPNELLRQWLAGASPAGDVAIQQFAQDLNAQSAALNGDIIMEISPATVTRTPTSAAWTRTVTVTFKDSNGNIHTWLTETFSTALSIGDTSTAGTASLPNGTDLEVVNGVATVEVAGDEQDWLDTETDTLTIANVTPSALNKEVTGGTSVETFAA